LTLQHATGTNKKPKPFCKEKYQQVSAGFYVSTDKTRMRSFEAANCNLK